MTEFVVTIGLETHVQLNTKTKIWCGCANGYGAEPNTQICPVCVGYPGTLPVLNREAIQKSIQAGLLLGCKINLRNKHDRKSYYYPDMPKNYQITQFDEPICIGGGLDIEVDGEKRFVELTRIHLEEDVGKSTHFDACSGVDYNRAGTPLMEIVTEPCMHTPDEVVAYLSSLKQILQYGGVSECNLEEGNIRCDLNVSLALPDAKELGCKVEIKNMNTFRGIHRALIAEIARQKKALETGCEVLVQETRRWDDDLGRTESMRSKEDAHDYRYFPDPDLMPIVLTEEEVEAIRATLPELPEARKARLQSELDLPEYDAEVLVADKAVADFFEATVAEGADAKQASNWIMTEVLRVVSEGDGEITSLKLTPSHLATLIKMIKDGAINRSGAKEIFAELLENGGEPSAIAKDKGLEAVQDTGEIEGFVDQAIAENPQSVESYKAGKENAMQHLVGQVMRFSRGKANPQIAIELLKSKLDA